MRARASPGSHVPFVNRKPDCGTGVSPVWEVRHYTGETPVPLRHWTTGAVSPVVSLYD